MSGLVVSAKGKGCWYAITIFECPICGITKTYRERQSTPRPDLAVDRYEFIHDACQGHFL